MAPKHGPSVQRLEISALKITLHSLRYGGNSWGKIEGIMTDEEIK